MKLEKLKKFHKIKKKRRAIRLKFVLAGAETRNEMIINTACTALLAAMLFISMGGLFISIFSVPVMWYLPLFAGCAAIAGMILTEQYPIKKRLIALAVAAGMMLLLWFVFFKFFRAGFYLIVNNIIDLYGISNLRIAPQYEVAVEPHHYATCTALMLTPAAFALGLLCNFVVKHSQKVIIALMLAAFAVMMAVLPSGQTGIWSALIFISVLMIICRSLVCANDSNGSGSIIAAVIAVLMTACAAGALVLLFIPSNVGEALEKKLDNVRYSAESFIHQKRYEGGETYVVMPEGSFKDISDEFEPTFENVLRINMTKSESLYLRGYVGEVYTDYGWRPLDKAKAGSYKSLFYQLYKSGFYPQTQLAKVASLLDSELTADSVITVDTSVKGACRGFIYAPYELCQVPAELMPNNVILSTGLYNPGFNGQTKYQYGILPNQSGRSHELGKMLEKQMEAPSEELANYLAMEAKYRSFVYDNYTAVSEEDSALLENYIGKPATEAYTHIPYDTAKQNILLALDRQLDYEEDVKAFDGEGSFLRFVIREMQEGYAPHYATVATLMLRHYGIPARYVEGYVITPDEAESNEDGKIRLADDVSHAWTEYYHDGLGWIPFETTPPYIDIMNGVSAPPMYQQPSDSNAEEDPPEFDRDRHKDDEDEGQQTASVIIRLSILLVIIALLLAFWYYRRKKALDARKATCEAEDNNAAVCAMMFYMRDLLDYCGISDKVNSAEALVFLIEDKWGAEAAADFGVATIIFMKAAFSSGNVTDLERDKVGDETKRILKKVDSLQNKRSRFVAKFIKFLY